MRYSGAERAALRTGKPLPPRDKTFAPSGDSDNLSEKQLAELKELLKDAESCARLTDWEENFCSDMRGRVLMYAERTRISAAQQKSIDDIKRKVYA